MKILFLSAWLPYPPINGAKIRIYNLIRQLSKQHEVTLLAFSQTIPLMNIPDSINELEKYCSSVHVVQARTFKARGLSDYKGFFSLTPRSVIQTYSSEMEDLIKKTLEHGDFNVVIASEVYAPALVSLLASKIKDVSKILDAIEITLAKDAFETQTDLRSKFRNGLTWFKLRWYTKKMLRATNGCTVPSIAEQKNIQGLAPKNYPVVVIPHSLDLERFQIKIEPEPNTLVFTGSFTYYANLDAVQYFTRDIFPAIRKQAPAAHLKILGSLNEVQPSQFLGYEAMTFTGLLNDVRQEVAKSWLSVVPLRLGAGTRLKIIESMALGTPVVSTRKGAEGLDIMHGENILLADTPVEISKAILDVLHNPHLRQTLSENGRALVKNKYSADAMGKNFNSFLEQVERMDVI